MLANGLCHKLLGILWDSFFVILSLTFFFFRRKVIFISACLSSKRNLPGSRCAFFRFRIDARGGGVVMTKFGALKSVLTNPIEVRFVYTPPVRVNCEFVTRIDWPKTFGRLLLTHIECGNARASFIFDA